MSAWAKEAFRFQASNRFAKSKVFSGFFCSFELAQAISSKIDFAEAIYRRAYT
jgi:hypothetical protein